MNKSGVHAKSKPQQKTTKLVKPSIKENHLKAGTTTQKFSQSIDPIQALKLKKRSRVEFEAGLTEKDPELAFRKTNKKRKPDSDSPDSVTNNSKIRIYQSSQKEQKQVKVIEPIIVAKNTQVVRNRKFQKVPSILNKSQEQPYGFEKLTRFERRDNRDQTKNRLLFNDTKESDIDLFEKEKSLELSYKEEVEIQDQLIKRTSSLNSRKVNRPISTEPQKSVERMQDNLLASASIIEHEVLEQYVFSDSLAQPQSKVQNKTQKKQKNLKPEVQALSRVIFIDSFQHKNSLKPQFARHQARIENVEEEQALLLGVQDYIAENEDIIKQWDDMKKRKKMIIQKLKQSDCMFEVGDIFLMNKKSVLGRRLEFRAQCPQ